MSPFNLRRSLDATDERSSNDSLQTTQLSSRRLLLRRAAGGGVGVYDGGLGGGGELTEQHDGLASSGAPRA